MHNFQVRSKIQKYLTQNRNSQLCWNKSNNARCENKVFPHITVLVCEGEEKKYVDKQEHHHHRIHSHSQDNKGVL